MFRAIVRVHVVFRGGVIGVKLLLIDIDIRVGGGDGFILFFRGRFVIVFVVITVGVVVGVVIVTTVIFGRLIILAIWILVFTLRLAIFGRWHFGEVECASRQGQHRGEEQDEQKHK